MLAHRVKVARHATAPRMLRDEYYEVLPQEFGRIAFANTDLSGVADHRSSIIEANRAVGQLLDQVLS